MPTGDTISAGGTAATDLVADPSALMTTNLVVAIAVGAAVEAGLCVLPVREDGSKAPDLPSWRMYQEVRPTPAELASWDFEHRAGYGVVAGPISDVEAWDVDCADVFDEFLARAQACGLGDLVSRVRADYEDRTGGNGIRWLIRLPPGVVWRDCTLARRPGRQGEPTTKTLIELPRFAVLAPSHGRTHPSGRRYVRVSGDFHTIAHVTADEREALVALARSFDTMPRRAYEPAPVRGVASVGDRPGDDFARRTTWPELLEPHGWILVYERDDVTYWRRPGKLQGVSGSSNFGGSDLFFCFTSSTCFAPDRSYSKFGAFAMLEHGGDFAAAAAALANKGFGRPGRRAASIETPTSTTTTDTRHRILTVTPASTIHVRPVRWLWDGRLALGSLNLEAGREGVGKTVVAATLTASVTRGNLPGVYFGTPKAVIIAATEDSWEHTLVPRLMVADADLDRVFRVDVVTDAHLQTALSLPIDLPELERVIREVDAALVIADPLLSRLDARLDSHKDAEVRLALEPLVAVAAAADVCVLGLIHVNKSVSADPLTVIMASRAFVAVARTVLFVAADPDDDSRRLLGTPKNNLGRTDLPTLAFHIVGAKATDTPEGEVWTGKLEWAGESDRSIREVIEHALETSLVRSATSEAAEWLQDYLTDQNGPIESAVAKREGGKAGLSKDALHRACGRLGVVIESRGFPRQTYWYLPSSHRNLGRHQATATTATTATTEQGRHTEITQNAQQSSQSSQSSQSVDVSGPRATTECEGAPAYVVEPDAEPALSRDHPAACPGCLHCDGPDRSETSRTRTLCDPWLAAELPLPPGAAEAAARVVERLAEGSLKRRRRGRRH
jgi:hypothetical protein